MKIALLEEINKYTPKKRKSFAFKYDENKSETLFDKSYTFEIWNLLIFSLLVVGVFFLLVATAVSIQISNKDKYLSLAEKNRIREFAILPGRGVIHDRNKKVIVRNKPSFTVEINTLICGSSENFKTCEQTISEVQKYIKVEDISRVLAEFAAKRTNILLSRGLTKEEILPLEANLSSLPGVSVDAAPTRDYLYKDAFAHVIGYVGLGGSLTPSIVGKSGVEEYYDNFLSGVAGNKVVQVDSLGTTYNLIRTKDPLPGKDITLYIDADLQQKAYELLKEKIEDKKGTATGGVVVAQDPTNGGILALVSYPSFDPNLLTSGISNEELNKINANPNFPFYNRAIGASYPPGSTFKLVTASAGLMEKAITEHTVIFDPGYIAVGSFIFRNWKTDGHGDVNLIRALQVSNDTYFYSVGGGNAGVKGIGIDKLHKWATDFGFGKRLGIDIAGEEPGFMPDGTERAWYLGDNFISAIGQGDILSTPLQTNSMLTYFANGGYIYKPRIVKSIDGEGETKSEIVARKLLDDKSYDLILNFFLKKFICFLLKIRIYI